MSEKEKEQKTKAEYLIWFFGILFVLNWFALWFVFPRFGETVFKISAIAFIVLAVICFILANILAKKEKENTKQDLKVERL